MNKEQITIVGLVNTLRAKEETLTELEKFAETLSQECRNQINEIQLILERYENI